MSPAAGAPASLGRRRRRAGARAGRCIGPGRSRSRKNLEVNIAVHDEPFAQYVRKWFDRDVETAARVDLFEWRARPLVRRGIEAMAYALRKLW
jgi:hypothetical protein